MGLVGEGDVPRDDAPVGQVDGVELGADRALRESLRRAVVLPRDVDEVGMVLQAGAGQAPARQAAIKAGLPPTVAARSFVSNSACRPSIRTR